MSGFSQTNTAGRTPATEPNGQRLHSGLLQLGRPRRLQLSQLGEQLKPALDCIHLHGQQLGRGSQRLGCVWSAYARATHGAVNYVMNRGREGTSAAGLADSLSAWQLNNNNNTSSNSPRRCRGQTGHHTHPPWLAGRLWRATAGWAGAGPGRAQPPSPDPAAVQDNAAHSTQWHLRHSHELQLQQGSRHAARCRSSADRFHVSRTCASVSMCPCSSSLVAAARAGTLNASRAAVVIEWFQAEREGPCAHVQRRLSTERWLGHGGLPPCPAHQQDTPTHTPACCRSQPRSPARPDSCASRASTERARMAG